MILLPAIDLFQGKAVRLLQGDYARMTVYGDPLRTAEAFSHAGAEWIHVVDLEGAKNGGTPNYPFVEALVRAGGFHVEVGGGARDEATVRRYLDAGAARVVLGTAAAERPDFAAEMAARYGEAIAVGVDLRDGFVAVRGWTRTSEQTGSEFCANLAQAGVQTVVCTDIRKDGAMGGANHALYRTLTKSFPSLNIVASGGVGSLEDVLALKELGLFGAIVGKAYYTGAIDLKTAIEVAK